ncbi:MAG: NAD-dependent epimerase/dehydratase family protein [Litorimonas sp.]
MIQNSNNNTVLVTGAGGFIGGHLIQQLTVLGWHVRAFDIAPPTPNLPSNIEWVQGSILDMSALEDAMGGVRHVYHMAALTHLGVPQTQRYEQINHVGTRNVITLSRMLGVEHLLITSTEVILRGWQDDNPAALNESDPLPNMEDMAGPYCRSKLAAEIIAREAIANGQAISILYPTVPIGAGDVNLTAPSAMIKAFMDKPPPAYLDCVFNLVAAQDVAKAHILAAQNPTGKRYILGGETVEMSKLLTLLAPLTDKNMPRRAVPYSLAVITAHASQMLAKLTGKAPLASLEGVRLARHKTIIDSSKARLELGWTTTPTKTALAQCVNYLKNM